MKKRWFVLCLAVLMLLLPAGVVIADSEGASHTVSDSDVTITISTDKKEYAAGEEIHYTIRIENNRTYWNINSYEFKYTNSEELIPADGGELPNTVPQVKYGTTYELSGTLIGDPAVFPTPDVTPTSEPKETPVTGTPAGNEDDAVAPASGNQVVIIVIAAVIVVAVGVVLLMVLKKGKKG